MMNRVERSHQIEANTSTSSLVPELFPVVPRITTIYTNAIDFRPLSTIREIGPN